MKKHLIEYDLKYPDLTGWRKTVSNIKLNRNKIIAISFFILGVFLFEGEPNVYF